MSINRIMGPVLPVKTNNFFQQSGIDEPDGVVGELYIDLEAIGGTGVYRTIGVAYFEVWTEDFCLFERGCLVMVPYDDWHTRV